MGWKGRGEGSGQSLQPGRGLSGAAQHSQCTAQGEWRYQRRGSCSGCFELLVWSCVSQGQQPARDGKRFRPFSFLVEHMDSRDEPHQPLHYPTVRGTPKALQPLNALWNHRIRLEKGMNHKILQRFGLEGSSKTIQCSQVSHSQAEGALSASPTLPWAPMLRSFWWLPHGPAFFAVRRPKCSTVLQVWICECHRGIEGNLCPAGYNLPSKTSQSPSQQGCTGDSCTT